MDTEDESLSDSERKALLSSSPRKRKESIGDSIEEYSSLAGSGNSFNRHRIQKTESMEAPGELPKGRYNKFIYGFVLVILTLASATMVAVALARWDQIEKPTEILIWQFKGFNFASGKYCQWVKYDSDRSDLSLSNLRTTGATWVAILINHFQHDQNSTSIYTNGFTPTSAELLHVIRQAKKLGLKIFLRPTIDLMDDPEHWRGDIGKFFTEQEWAAWFTSWTNILLPYLQVAQQEGVEMISLGNDLICSSNREREWRQLISSVRSIYKGLITYSANWGGEETDKQWWDAVDFIGIDAYYPLIPYNPSPSIEDLVQEWDDVINKGVYQMRVGLKNLTSAWNKSIIFTEIGYCSGQCPVGEKINLEFQTNHYAAVFEAFQYEGWFAGIFWWNWLSDPAYGGEFNYCYTPQYKPAEKLVRQWYGGLADPQQPLGGPVCSCEENFVKPNNV